MCPRRKSPASDLAETARGTMTSTSLIPRKAYCNALAWLLLESKAMHSVQGSNVNFCVEFPTVYDSSDKL